MGAPSGQRAIAEAFVTDSAVYAPPSSGSYAYYATYGTFGPDQSGFPGQGGSFVDPIFGGTISRLTNEMGQQSSSEIYSKNGYFNADGTLTHHRSPSGHNIISTSTGQVVRAGVPFNYDSSFAPDDPDAWYYFAFGDTTLYKYSVSTGNQTVVKTFPGALASLGGSVDWIDRTGRYMVLNVGGQTRVYDKSSDTLYSGAIPGSYGGGGGWIGISPDANYVITSTPSTSSHSWRIDHANKSVSTSPVLFWTLCGGHGDVVSASDGKTYFVTFDCNSTGSIYAVDVSLPQSASNVAQQLAQNRKLIQLSSWSDVDGHFSRVSKGAMQDWVFGSVESSDDEVTSGVDSWRAFKQEIVMMNVLTGEVRRLAHHRSRSLGTSYYAQPRVNATWDGSVVAWTSNFGYSGSGYADLYALRVYGTTPVPSPPPPPPPPAPVPSPLALSFTNPAANTTVSGTVTVALAASGGSGSGYYYTLTAGTTTIYSGGTNSGYSWNTTMSPNGGVTLLATVTDSAGASTSASVSVTVANSSPTPTPTPTPGSDTVPPTVEITSPRSGVWTGNSIQVSARAKDNGGVAQLELWGAGNRFASFTCKSGSCSGSIWWITGPLPPGAYQVNAVAVDKAGNRSRSATITIYKDATSPTYASGAPATAGVTPPGSGGMAPKVALTGPPTGTWTGNSRDVSLSATSDVRLATLGLDADGVVANLLPCADTTCGGTVLGISAPKPSNAHALTAVATDSSGNRTMSTPITIVN